MAKAIKFKKGFATMKKGDVMPLCSSILANKLIRNGVASEASDKEKEAALVFWKKAHPGKYKATKKAADKAAAAQVAPPKPKASEEETSQEEDLTK